MNTILNFLEEYFFLKIDYYNFVRKRKNKSKKTGTKGLFNEKRRYEQHKRVNNDV